MVSVNSYLHGKWIVFFGHLEHVNSNFTCLTNRVEIKVFMFEINNLSLFVLECHVIYEFVSSGVMLFSIRVRLSQFKIDYLRVYSNLTSLRFNLLTLFIT